MIIATAGHIDHGKTTLVAALTGVETDRLPEEKSRGLTIDLGFAYQSLNDGQILGFVDVPGHERFVRNMLAGVTGIDFALLVVAADDGIMAQTEEHLAILDLLNINSGAVAISKIDAISKSRVAEVERHISDQLKHTTLKDAKIFQVSGITGAGIPELKQYLEDTAKQHKARSKHGHFRLAIDRCFTMTGAGLIVTGTAFSGSLAVGDQLVISPENLPVRVRAVHAQSKRSEAGMAGQRLGVNITGSGLKKTEIHRGDWLLERPIHMPTRRIDCRIRCLASEKKSLKHWTSVHVHLGSKEVLGHIAILGDKELHPGHRALTQLVLDKEICALKGDRVVLRDSSAQRTVGGGYVIDPFGAPRGRSKPERLDMLELMDDTDPAKVFTAVLARTPRGLDLTRFRLSMNLKESEFLSAVQDCSYMLAGQDEKPKAFADSSWAALQQDLLDTLAEAHKSAPDEPGIPEDKLRRQMNLRVEPSVFRTLIDQSLDSELIRRSGANIRLPSHQAKISKSDQEFWDKLMPLLQVDGFRPPVVHDLAESIGSNAKLIDGVLRRAERFGLVYRVADNRYFLPEDIWELARIVEALISTSSDHRMSVISFRDTSGIGRNLAVQVLEFFDRVGLTVREGNVRRQIKPVDEVFPQSE